MTLPLVSACTTLNNKQPPPEPVTILPALPNDLKNCEETPVKFDFKKGVNKGKTEKYWKTDRAKLVKVNKCQKRTVNIYESAREKTLK